MTHLRQLGLLFSIPAAVISAFGQTGASWLQDLHFKASATAAWTDNISRTSFLPTSKDAASYEFAVGASNARQLAPNLLLEVGADAAALSIPDFDRNNHFTIGPRLGLQRKFGLGPLAPVLRLDTAYTYKSARIQANTGWTAEAALRYSQRITSSVKIGASGEWLEHYARRSTYDIQQRTVSIDASWDISEHWRLSGSAGRLNGRIVANAAPQIWSQAITGGLGATVFNYYTTIPWQVVDSYGPGWTAYNVAAHADLWSIALATTLSDRTTFELRTSSFYVVNKIDVRYSTKSVGLSLIHRF